ncbi:DUF86 domain-containing protein [Flammeovirga yaeyamensis]|uniref:DUF86 domain-containing protein n=1 Tax=Flammeovirga yaeyamensis TaxID=367791 RepID=A0AAX1MZP8_9BACT|nr:HepT-like ribonuclease domain-containing protein [Flammeovirga yaeyamensis]MBB3700330.1 uncharacterized protein with HEPN domain [Flammeovirga yaeyamensis]NMF37044.1 DUF86 domain-containing protein [Flammeovirga yaeyamensis]QWG00736.1 DUF86 domain-containing protein [Flammeovirga yaeyamensis]
MKNNLLKSLFDIKDSIEAIFDYLDGKRDFNEYQKNRLLRRAIEREIEIIGEATYRILKIDPNFPISNAWKIVDTRNWVIHGCDFVDDFIIWNIIINHLPNLIKEVDQEISKRES